MNKELDVVDLHSEHKEWNNTLSFYLDEMKTFQNRLSEIAEKNTETDLRKNLEKFQNQFIIQKNNIASLKNDIQKHELNLGQMVKNDQSELKSSDLYYHGLVKEKVDSQSRVFVELKKEFYSFMAKVM